MFDETDMLIYFTIALANKQNTENKDEMLNQALESKHVSGFE